MPRDPLTSSAVPMPVIVDILGAALGAGRVHNIEIVADSPADLRRRLEQLAGLGADVTIHETPTVCEATRQSWWQGHATIWNADKDIVMSISVTTICEPLPAAEAP